MRHAELIAVGSELLTPYRSDTNSLWITDRLNRFGITVTRKLIVGDDRTALADIFREAGTRADLVIATGGLGPTFDDITRDALADALGLELVFTEEIWKIIVDMYGARRRTPTENNRRQALVPRGGRWFPNAMGTAPGLLVPHHGRHFVLLPGPPIELQNLWPAIENELFRDMALAPVYTRKFKFVNIPESLAESRLTDVRLPPEADWTILAAFGQVEAHLRVRTADRERAEQVFADFENVIVERIGRHYFGIDDTELEGAAGHLLERHGHLLATAESCTGGMLAQRITAIAGSSAWFRQGLVTYANEAKVELLGVSEETLRQFGAVSRETALEMARGARERAGVQVSAAITGIAGPGGGSEEKPVGTVYVAVIHANGREKCHRFLFRGDREKIRFQATQVALDMIRLGYEDIELESGFMVK